MKERTIVTSVVALLVAGVVLVTRNTDVIFVGRKAVTADAAVGTGGVPLLPGSSIDLPIEDPSQIYVISQSSNQDLAWMGV